MKIDQKIMSSISLIKFYEKMTANNLKMISNDNKLVFLVNEIHVSYIYKLSL